jgi:hypothetical protein
MTGVEQLIVAGCTGRDEAALRKHIRELEELGVRRTPSRSPVRTRARWNSCCSPGHGLWVTVGFDHTNRKAETIGVSLSKQLCAKVIGKDAWRYDEVKDHWEALVLRSCADGEIYQ